MEEFQGQERKIIMISTVRSSVNYVKMDKDFSIGFLSNEKVGNIPTLTYKAVVKPVSVAFTFRAVMQFLFFFLLMCMCLPCRGSMWL